MQEFLKAYGFVYKKPKGIPGKHSDVENQQVMINKLTGLIEDDMPPKLIHSKVETMYL